MAIKNQIIWSIFRWFALSIFLVLMFWIKNFTGKGTKSQSLFEQSFYWINIWLLCIVIWGIILTLAFYLELIRKAKLIPIIDTISTQFNNITYPIIAFGWIFAEPYLINNFQIYRGEFLLKEWKLEATYIIDSQLRKFKIITKKYNYNNEIVNYEDLKEWEVIWIENLKSKIIRNIWSIKDSSYSGLEDEIRNSNSIHEIIKVLDKLKF